MGYEFKEWKRCLRLENTHPEIPGMNEVERILQFTNEPFHQTNANEFYVHVNFIV